MTFRSAWAGGTGTVTFDASTRVWQLDPAQFTPLPARPAGQWRARRASAAGHPEANVAAACTGAADWLPSSAQHSGARTRTGGKAHTDARRNPAPDAEPRVRRGVREDREHHARPPGWLSSLWEAFRASGAGGGSAAASSTAWRCRGPSAEAAMPGLPRLVMAHQPAQGITPGSSASGGGLDPTTQELSDRALSLKAVPCARGRLT